MAEGPLVQRLSVLPSASEPCGDGGLPVAEDSFGRRWVQPFGQRREHHGDLVRGGFQPIQGGVTSSAERGAASLTTERLDPLRLTMLAIANERMNVSVGDPEVRALLIGTGVAFGVYLFGCSPAAFDLAPGTHRPRRRLSTRRGSGGETTGGAIVWAAGLEKTLHRGALGPSS
jgi:hypothetical protein